MILLVYLLLLVNALEGSRNVSNIRTKRAPIAETCLVNPDQVKPVEEVLHLEELNPRNLGHYIGSLTDPSPENAKKALKFLAQRGSFFENMKMTIQEVLFLAADWIENPTKPVRETAVQFGVSLQTVVELQENFRQMTMQWFNREGKRHLKLGGPGKIVEIDETLVVRAKYNRGRNLNRKQIWVFGMIERGSKKVVMFRVQKRDAATLLPIIEKYVLPEDKNGSPSDTEAEDESQYEFEDEDEDEEIEDEEDDLGAGYETGVSETDDESDAENDVAPSTVPLHQLSGFPVSSRNARRQQLKNERRGVTRNPSTRGTTRNSERSNLARNAGLRGNPVATAGSSRTVAQQQNPHAATGGSSRSMARQQNAARRTSRPSSTQSPSTPPVSPSEIPGPRDSVLSREASPSGNISFLRRRPASPGAARSPGASRSRGASTSPEASRSRGVPASRGASASPEASASRAASASRGTSASRAAPASRGVPASRGTSASRGASALRGASTSRGARTRGATTTRGAATTRGATTSRGRSASPNLMTGTRTRSSFRNRSDFPW
ncbi:hypothetical protein CAEBREN_20458 [Caenorhabditis brenneri]|uniref:ISXO2-like transposase domain-containing protein n=1 Tax=Caenorhabditis brenneri TaxID=135651 RepID=G0NY58_CAEBE|nr:hypothetical protein CAEBREN_20458 [Caenorhabditis brenneri]